MEIFDKKNILVSVILATYRREDSLKNAIGSILNQSYHNIELIIVDDNAENIWNKKVERIIEDLKSLKSMNIVYVQNKKNMGSAETRNIGIKIAKGDYITFLDDDDIYLPEKIFNQLNNMLENISDYSITDLYLYNEDGKLVEKRTRDYIKCSEKNELFRYHIMYHMTGTDTLMFKRNYLIDVGGFPPIDIGDEFYLMQRAIEYGGKFSYLPVCDVKAYLHIDTSGLSSGETKINGEKELHNHKKKYFYMLSKRDKRYINMRHFAVLAFAELRQKKIIPFFLNAVYSFDSSPIECFKLIYKFVKK